MIQLLNFISNVKLFLYAGCALVFLAAVRYWWTARRERKRTIYGLEKEVAGERSLRALTFAALAMGVAFLIYLADTNAPAAPVSPQRSPTPNVAFVYHAYRHGAAAHAHPGSAHPDAAEWRGRVPATGRRARRPPARRRQPRHALPPACPDPSVRITSPGIDAHLSGVVSVAGTAAIPNFQYYKVEFAAGDPPQSWHVLGDVRRRQVSEGVLETFNAGTFAPGVYYLRLTVVDQTGNFPVAPCAVRVVLGQ